ncbi:MAG: asparagine synthase-related protein [Gammaproteobacteria bacterium]
MAGEEADELFSECTHHSGFSRLEPLHEALLDSVPKLHNMNFQRVDRMTLAHSIEERGPFLEVDVFPPAGRIAPKLKRYKTLLMERWRPRLAFEGAASKKHGLARQDSI